MNSSDKPEQSNTDSLSFRSLYYILDVSPVKKDKHEIALEISQTKDEKTGDGKEKKNGETEEEKKKETNKDKKKEKGKDDNKNKEKNNEVILNNLNKLILIRKKNQSANFGSLRKNHR